jgi:hypothetical protein
MIQLNRVGEIITGTANGKSFSVTFTQQKWDAMQDIKRRAGELSTMAELRTLLEQEFEPLMHESYKDVIESQSPYLHVNPLSNRFFLKYGTEVSKEPLPQVFVDRILESTEKHIDPRPLVKCWARFLRNPNYSAKKAELFAYYINQKYTDAQRRDQYIKDGMSYERANELATGYQTPITDEGLICTYKVSEEITKRFIADPNDEESVKQVSRYQVEVDEFSGLKTYKTPEDVEDRIFLPAVQGRNGDKFSQFEPDGTFIEEGHHIRVGKVHALKEWSMVNCDDDRSCVPGLHCGNLDYIRSYQSKGTITHYVFVDPMHIGAVVQDKTGALRVKQYMVYASFAGVTRSLYHSATYGKLTDKEYEDLVRDVVSKTRDEQISKLNEQYNAKLSLVGDGGI